MTLSVYASCLVPRRAFFALIQVVVLARLAVSIGCKRWDYASCYGANFRVLDWHLGAAQDQWLGWKAFKEEWLRNKETDFVGKPYLSVEVQQVPCKAYGCCNLQLYFRPNTTDYNVFEQVFPWHYFNFLYDRLDDPKYIVDAGANVGYASMLFSLLYPKAKIIAIEPDPNNFQVLKLNTMKFPNVHAVNAGVWEKNTYITTTGKFGEWGFMFKEVSDPDKKEGTLGLTIPSLLEKFEFPRVDYAKIDVEGAEGVIFGPKADLSWLNETTFVSLELHDGMAKYYGLEKVSPLVRDSMKGRGFQEDHDNEHWFYTRPSPGGSRSGQKQHKRHKPRGLLAADC